MKYYNFLNIFSRDEIDKFFSYRFNNYKISLIFKKKSIFDLLYFIFQNKFRILKKYFNNNLIKGFIYFNSFFATFLILFAYKLNRKLHLYVNYQALNAIIIKNKYLLLLI